MTELLPALLQVESSQLVFPENGSQALISAQDDVAAIITWLARHRKSPRTLENYRKEAERIYLWSRRTGKTLAQLTYDDTVAFEGFLANPPAELISRIKRPRTSPDWRPFAGPLAPSSVTQALRIVNGLFSWLVKARYIHGNPFSLGGINAPKVKRLVRYLSPEQVAQVLATIADMPEATDREKIHKARCRWIFALLYLTGMRITEISKVRMEGFFSRKSADGKVRWWATFIGKGFKEAVQPVTSDLLRELQSYRLAMDLPALPLPSENLPAVMRIGKMNRDKVLDRTVMHNIIKTIFLKTAERLKANGDAHGAAEIERASAHWMRHAMGSSLSNQGASMPVVRDALRHESLTTTSIYVHNEEDALHDEIERLHKLPI